MRFECRLALPGLAAAALILSSPPPARADENTCNAVLKIASDSVTQARSSALQSTFYNNICTQRDITMEEADRIWSSISAGGEVSIPIYGVLVGGKAHYDPSNEADTQQFYQDLQRTCNTISATDHRAGTFYEQVITANRRALESWDNCMRDAQNSETIRAGVEVNDDGFIVYINNYVNSDPVTEIYNFTPLLTWPRSVAKPATASDTATCYYQNKAVTFPQQFHDRELKLVCQKPTLAAVELAVGANARRVDANDKLVAENDPLHSTMTVTIPSQDPELNALKAAIATLQSRVDTKTVRPLMMPPSKNSCMFSQSDQGWPSPSCAAQCDRPDDMLISGSCEIEDSLGRAPILMNMGIMPGSPGAWSCTWILDTPGIKGRATANCLHFSQ